MTIQKKYNPLTNFGRMIKKMKITLIMTVAMTLLAVSVAFAIASNNKLESIWTVLAIVAFLISMYLWNRVIALANTKDDNDAKNTTAILEKLDKLIENTKKK
jgi:ABC-type spermidine/putrescine transport system permease subunit I